MAMAVISVCREKERDRAALLERRADGIDIDGRIEALAHEGDDARVAVLRGAHRPVRRPGTVWSFCSELFFC